MPDGLNASGQPDLSRWRTRLEAWLCERFSDPSLRLRDICLLEGGAVQRNWRLDVETGDGTHTVVLRTDPDIALAESRSKPHEFAMLSNAHAHGLPVCRPLWLEDSREILDRPFLVSEFRGGNADRAKLYARAPMPALLEELARALAGIHRLPLPSNTVRETPSVRAVLLSTWAEQTPGVPDGIAQGLSWLRDNAPDIADVCVVHRDYRTGNFLVNDAGLIAVLDWEFAGFGDPVEDIGWFLARCWRGANTHLEAGGLGTREAFLDCYAAAGGKKCDPARIRFWEIFAHVRWALVTIQQGARARAGEYPRHELEEAAGRTDGLARDIARLVREAG